MTSSMQHMDETFCYFIICSTHSSRHRAATSQRRKPKRRVAECWCVQMIISLPSFIFTSKKSKKVFSPKHVSLNSQTLFGSFPRTRRKAAESSGYKHMSLERCFVCCHLLLLMSQTGDLLVPYTKRCFQITVGTFIALPLPIVYR